MIFIYYMAECDISSNVTYNLNFNTHSNVNIKNNSYWNIKISSKDAKENSWNYFISTAKGMLHQYTNQQFSNLNNHYSPLNSCSHLLQQSYTQVASKEEFDGVIEQTGFYPDEKYRSTENTPRELQNSESDKRFVPNSELFEKTQQQQQHCDIETSQLINDEQNNNVEKSQIKNESFDYQKFEQENDMIPFLDLDMETIINPFLNENEEYKRTLQTTANEINKICDESEPNFRLPGFHQAFGSTEIGRYVHQKDFIEQTVTQSDVNRMKPALQNNPSNMLDEMATSPKPKSRCRRIKTPAEMRNQCWPYDHEDDNTVCSPINGNYCKRKDVRISKGGYNSHDNTAPGYYNSDEYYSCSSYYGGCSNYTNCEYYRYQQNSQYQNYLPSSYSNVHFNNYNNNYNRNDEHSQRLPYSPSSSSASSSSSPLSTYNHNNQNWRSERFFPYGDQFPYRYRQNSSSYMYQQFAPQNQHLSQQQYNCGYNTYSAIGLTNYNYY